MKAVVSDIRIQFSEFNKPEIILLIDGNRAEILAEATELKSIISNKKLLYADITPLKRKRSLDSNSYLWILSQKIAEALHTTKELVYQKVIRDVGQFEIVPIKNEAVERWIEVWKGKGLGWFAEVMEDSKLSGYKKVISYYGSSCYDQREMSVLLDEIVSQCKELDIETMTPNEIAELKSSWKG
jgi:hypothetical protein